MKKREAFILILLATMVVLTGTWLFISTQDKVSPNEPQPVKQESTVGVPTLETQEMLSGLKNVWDVGFTPSGIMLFTERGGEISKLSGGKKQVLLKVPNVLVRGEGGLLGIAIDPDFAQNRYVYACYNTPQDIRVSRWKLDDAENTLVDQKEIVTGMPNNTTTFPGRHSGCRPRFGPDNNLWIGTGDVAIGTNPQAPGSLGGKILRVDRNGAAVAGNLKSPFDTRIFSYGHRNVQGLAMFSEIRDGQFGYSVEHGTSVDDEVNRIVSGNFGYNPVPGYNESVSMTDTEKFPDAITALWASGPTIAPSGATILTGEKWGSYQNRVAVAVLKDKQIKLFEFGADNSLKSQTTLLQNTFGRIRTAVMGTDGNLYISTDNGSDDSIIKVTPK